MTLQNGQCVEKHTDAEEKLQLIYRRTTTSKKDQIDQTDNPISNKSISLEKPERKTKQSKTDM